MHKTSVYRFFRNTLKSFTLSEVIITLTIIGTISAITIPKVYQKYQEQVTVTRLRNVYKELNKSYQLAIRTFGPPQYWGLQKSSFGTDKNGKKYGINPSGYMPYEKMLIGLDAEYVVDKIPAYNTPALHNVVGIVNKINPAYRLKDGTVLFYPPVVDSANCSLNRKDSDILKDICGSFNLDTNGAAGPNIVGRDVFVLYFTKTGIVPLGLKGDSRLIETHCNKDSKEQHNGHACSGWVIYKGNQDYLRKPISWD